MIGTQFIKQQTDEGHLLLQEIPLSPLINPRNELIINKLCGFSVSPLPKIRPKSHPKLGEFWKWRFL